MNRWKCLTTEFVEIWMRLFHDPNRPIPTTTRPYCFALGSTTRLTRRQQKQYGFSLSHPASFMFPRFGSCLCPCWYVLQEVRFSFKNTTTCMKLTCGGARAPQYKDIHSYFLTRTLIFVVVAFCSLVCSALQQACTSE